MGYKQIPTSAEVYAVIRARHRDLVVFSSFSDPDGSFNGGDTGTMETVLGFKDAGYPLIKIKTTWEINREKPYERNNAKNEYWLCVADSDD